MIPNNRPLKAYVRYDGQGRVVSSSLILRKNKPKVGKWKEVQTYECCDTFECVIPTVLFSQNVTFGFPVNTNNGCFPTCGFESTCGTYFIVDIRSFVNIPNNCTLEQFFNFVNQYYNWVGTWTLDNTTIQLEMDGELAKAICPTGEITMNINVACPA
jgi:hypothetical protein